MTTALIDSVTRRTGLSVDGREVEVTLVPGSIETATPESISFHLVGLHEKSDKSIPLPYLLRLAGYKVKLPKDDGLSAEDEIARLFKNDPYAAKAVDRILKSAREAA